MLESISDNMWIYGTLAVGIAGILWVMYRKKGKGTGGGSASKGDPKPHKQ
jgi:hypothetical protein